WASVKSQPRNVHPVVQSPERSCPRKLSFSKTSFSSSASRSGLIAHLGEQPLEPGLGRVVDEGHRRCDARVDCGDRVTHLQGDGPVGRVPLAAGAKLDQVERLPRVELEDVADAIGETERIRRPSTRPSPRSRSYSARDVSRARAYSAPRPASSTSCGTSAPRSGESRCHWHVSRRWRWRSRKAP